MQLHVCPSAVSRLAFDDGSSSFGRHSRQKKIPQWCHCTQNCASLAFRPTAHCTSVTCADAVAFLLLSAAFALFCGLFGRAAVSCQGCREGKWRSLRLSRPSGDSVTLTSTAGSGLVAGLYFGVGDMKQGTASGGQGGSDSYRLAGNPLLFRCCRFVLWHPYPGLSGRRGSEDAEGHM